jgi:hypothetical protein
MQPGDGKHHFTNSEDALEDEPDGSGSSSGRPESIRDLQRRRRDASRYRTEIEAILATPPEGEAEEEEEEDIAPPSGPPPARVFVVFRGVKWQDPDGNLRESDTIVGVYATEEAARSTVSELNRAGNEQEEAWYQPYNVEP